VSVNSRNLLRYERSYSHMRKIAEDLRPPEDYIEYSSDEARGSILSHPYRSAFMRDRDNILYHKAFFRLALKTQVITFGKNDHARSRMTHTLEVVQIARTISKMLGLDEDLTEAIALGHDIGHTPFGHVGERTLNMLTNNCERASVGYSLGEGERGFKHNLNSMRILAESKAKGFTNFTLFGIANHSKMSWGTNCKGWDASGICPTPTTSRRECKNHGKTEVDYYDKYRKYYCIKGKDQVAWSLEAYVVCWADEIAQRHHDIEDAITLNLIDIDALKTKIEEVYKLCNKYSSFLNDQVNEGAYEIIEKKWKLLEKTISQSSQSNKNVKDLLIDRFASFIVDAYVTYIVALFAQLTDILKKEYPFTDGKTGIVDRDDFEKRYCQLDPSHIQKIFTKFITRPWDGDMKNNESKAFEEMDTGLQRTLMSIIINSGEVQRLDGKASYVIRSLAKAYLTNPQQLPDKPIIEAFNCTITKLNNDIEELREKLALIKKTCDFDDSKEKIIQLEYEVSKKEKEKYELFKLTELPMDIEVNQLQPFQCRNALTVIRSDAEAIKLLRVNILRTTVHHIANMTDRYAMEEYSKLY